MPIAHFHVVESTREQRRRLIEAATAAYATTFESPVERIRIFVHDYPGDAVGVGGRSIADGAGHAPFFTALAMAGRPLQQRQAILREFTAILAEVFEVDRSVVRGYVIECAPENWGIGGEPASVLRAAEIAARAG